MPIPVSQSLPPVGDSVPDVPSPCLSLRTSDIGHWCGNPYSLYVETCVLDVSYSASAKSFYQSPRTKSKPSEAGLIWKGKMGARM